MVFKEGFSIGKLEFIESSSRAVVVIHDAFYGAAGGSKADFKDRHM